MAQRKKAEELLFQAVQAQESGRYSESLTLYQQSLHLWMELYKSAPDGTSTKKELLEILQQNMSEAEKVKVLINSETQSKHNLVPPPSPQEPFSTYTASKDLLSPTNSRRPLPVVPTNNNKLPMPPTPPTNLLSPSSTSSATKKPLNSTNGTRKPLPGGDKGPVKAPLPDYHDYSHRTPVKPPIPVTRTVPASKRTLERDSSTSSNKSTGKSAPLTTTEPKKAPENEYTSQIMDGILDKSPGVRWDDIAGLDYAKQTLQEAIILPNLRPDLFTGLRSPPKGVLLFGPPGTGKTLLAKAVATESGFVFFSISASSVTSKYLGEGEKLVKALFEIAREKQPSVIFIDEIDALMSTRKDNEHEASRRLKTEFMTQIDGACSSSEDRILIMGATNLPWDIDEAVLRRLPKRIYVPLPDPLTRKALITNLLKKQGPAAGGIQGRSLDRIVQLTDGYSGSDLSMVCHEAALGPIRELDPSVLRTIKAEEIRKIEEKDFVGALKIIRPSVSGDNLKAFKNWADQFGITK